MVGVCTATLVSAGLALSQLPGPELHCTASTNSNYQTRRESSTNYQLQFGSFTSNLFDFHCQLQSHDLQWPVCDTLTSHRQRKFHWLSKDLTTKHIHRDILCRGWISLQNTMWHPLAWLSCITMPFAQFANRDSPIFMNIDRSIIIQHQHLLLSASSSSIDSIDNHRQRIGWLCQLMCSHLRWAEARIKITRMTLTIKRDRNWSSFQLANSAPPLSVTGSAIAPSARIAKWAHLFWVLYWPHDMSSQQTDGKHQHVNHKPIRYIFCWIQFWYMSAVPSCHQCLWPFSILQILILTRPCWQCNHCLSNASMGGVM